MLTEEIRAELFRMQDEAYRDFQGKLIPTVDPENIIGVRTPELRKYAKQLVRREDIRGFLDVLPHKYFDENQLHAFIISEIKDYDVCMEEVNRSEETYTVRFGVGMLMQHFLDDDFEPEYPELVSMIRSGEYYVHMMIAWYFATALAKQYDQILPYIEKQKLDVWTHNKTIQKAVESYRITPEQKEYLKGLKIRQ